MKTPNNFEKMKVTHKKGGAMLLGLVCVLAGSMPVSAETIVKFSSTNKLTQMAEDPSTAAILEKLAIFDSSKNTERDLKALINGGEMVISEGAASTSVFSNWVLDDRLTLKENLENWVYIHNSRSKVKVRLIWPDSGPGVFNYSYAFNGSLFEAVARLGLAAKSSGWPVSFTINTTMNTIEIKKEA